MHGRVMLAIAVLASAASAAIAAPIDGATELRAKQQAAYEHMPDGPGTGAFPATREPAPGLPNHLLYRPVDLGAIGRRKLGIYIWGNGGCSADAASARLHLLEIASHGYLAIATGTALTGPGGIPAPSPPRRPADGAFPPVKTTSADLKAALDWALAENSRPGSPFFGRIDPGAVAVAGHSCGGLQALQLGADPRVKTVIVLNSGVINPGAANPIRGLTINKSALAALHTPVLYVLGGPTDIAFANGSDDFARINALPVMLASTDTGHGGTFHEPNGGRVAALVSRWLDWRLREDPAAARSFSGPDCGYCRDPAWTIRKKNID